MESYESREPQESSIEEDVFGGWSYKYYEQKISQIKNGDEVLLIETPKQYSELGIIIGYYNKGNRLAAIDYEFGAGCDIYVGPKGQKINDDPLESSQVEEVLSGYFSTQD